MTKNAVEEETSRRPTRMFASFSYKSTWSTFFSLKLVRRDRDAVFREDGGRKEGSQIEEAVKFSGAIPTRLGKARKCFMETLRRPVSRQTRVFRRVDQYFAASQLYRKRDYLSVCEKARLCGSGGVRIPRHPANR